MIAARKIFLIGFLDDCAARCAAPAGAADEKTIDVAPMPFVTQNIHPLALAAHAPHPNAGKGFIDYVLSREGQGFIKNMGRVISRSDILQEDLARTKLISEDVTIGSIRSWTTTRNTCVKGPFDRFTLLLQVKKDRLTASLVRHKSPAKKVSG
jgi:ABC-type Fe3+ transport system substrate-binding protein